MKFSTVLLTFGFGILTISASAQTDSVFLNHAISALKNQPVTEKVYLHLDKQNYGFGDTIWYKAYTVVGEHHQLSALSSVLYVELISPKDSMVARQILPLVSGTGWSDIPLLPTLKQGNYRIRAYTNWMRNAGPDYFYNQKIRIGGIPVETNTQKPTTQVNPDVQFFPEGGELVNGIRSRIAFKAMSTKGLGEAIKGTVEDNEGDIVADFASQHLGMGEFAFTPQSGKTYKAKISGAGEAGFTVELPKAQEEGYTLALNNSEPDSIYIKVAVNEKTLNGQKNSTFYIIAQSSGKVYYTSESKLEGLVYSAKVEKSRFPSGIAQFTLFSQSGEPLAERVAFIQNSDTLKLSLAASSAYNTRGSVKLNLDAKGPDNNPVAGSFSVAVINESLVGTDEQAESTILNNLLLTSDLKGYVEQPNYYFINVNDQKRADLDLLMSSQGYRKFEWKQALNNYGSTTTYQPEKSLDLAGTVKTSSGVPIPDARVNLIATKDNLLRDTTTDANGNFKFADLSLMDTTSLVLKARKNNNDDRVIISIKPTEYPAITAFGKDNAETKAIQPEALAAMQKKYTDYEVDQQHELTKNGILLKQVTIHGNRPPKSPELIHSSNLNGPGHANQIIMGDVVEGCVTLSDCLNGKVFGVKFGSDGTPYSNRVRSISGPASMVIIVDGIIMDGKHLNDLNASDIYSIEVLRSGSYLAIYGSNAPFGALVITSKRGGEDAKRLTPKPFYGLLAYNFTGYYKTKTFYTPKYAGPKTDAQQPDAHTTIYWNPNIITDKDGKASFAYFNNDTKGAYRVVIEGIDDNGNLGRMVYRYKVE